MVNESRNNGKLSVDLLKNLRKIINDRGITQAAMAEYAGMTESQFSRVLSGQVQLSLKNLANIASSLGMREIDIFTYPDVYVNRDLTEYTGERVSVTFEIDPSHKESLLKLVAGIKK